MFSSQAYRRHLRNSLDLPDEKVADAAQITLEFRAQLDHQHVAGHATTNSDEALRLEYNKKILSLFPAEKATKLQELSRIQKGPSALLDPDIAVRLQLSRAQRDQLSFVNSKIEADERDAINNLPRVTADYLAKLRAGFWKRKENEMTTILDAQQRKKWSQILSEDKKNALGK
jgi:hypothetical protein